uniref:Uncharacterized protein n=1 Tax=Trichogramma kaykai TaxID=54128 RepID=A0ABD2W3H9_9HYME
MMLSEVAHCNKKKLNIIATTSLEQMTDLALPQDNDCTAGSLLRRRRISSTIPSVYTQDEIRSMEYENEQKYEGKSYCIKIQCPVSRIVTNYRGYFMTIKREFTIILAVARYSSGCGGNSN